MLGASGVNINVEYDLVAAGAFSSGESKNSKQAKVCRMAWMTVDVCRQKCHTLGDIVGEVRVAHFKNVIYSRSECLC